jgi:DNA mismatch endonuclease, patch repair protein
MRDKLSKARRSWNMSRIRGRDTTPEKIVRSLLHRLGFRFRLYVKHLPARPDVVLPSLRTVVLVHGCFWHRHEGCKNCTTPTNNQKFWLKKFDGNVARDKVNEQKLRETGWNCVVVWECETKDVETLKQRLKTVLGPLRKQRHVALVSPHKSHEI